MVDPGRLAEACASLDADVLCLQEIDRGQARSGGADQTAAVADALGAPAWRFQPALIGEPGGVWRAATGEAGEENEPGYGVGIVSRLPVEEWHVLRLAAAPVRAPVFVPGGKGRAILLPDEPRLVLAAELSGLVVATTHLSFVPGYNLVQLRRATRWLATLGPGPCILLGDLNVPGPFPGLASGWRPLTKARTYPADRPALQVDHVLGQGALPPVVRTATRRLALSDHLAVIVELGDGPNVAQP